MKRLSSARTISTKRSGSAPRAVTRWSRGPARGAPRVTVQDRQHRLRLDRAGLRRAAEIALAAERYRAGELALVFVDDRRIARLNARYLGHCGPTDVLAFGSTSQSHRLQRGAPRWLGDIVISTQTAQRQAPHWRRRVGEELAEYVIHGVLHLAGYDDATATGRRRMERRQEALLVQWRSARLTRSS